MAVEVIIRVSWWLVGGERLKTPDNLCTLTTTNQLAPEEVAREHQAGPTEDKAKQSQEHISRQGETVRADRHHDIVSHIHQGRRAGYWKEQTILE